MKSYPVSTVRTDSPMYTHLRARSLSTLHTPTPKRRKHQQKWLKHKYLGLQRPQSSLKREKKPSKSQRTARGLRKAMKNKRTSKWERKAGRARCTGWRMKLIRSSRRRVPSPLRRANAFQNQFWVARIKKSINSCSLET